MEKHIKQFLKDLKEQQDEIAKYLFGKSDIEITAKIVFENIPTSYVYSDEGQEAIEEATRQFKENMAQMPNAKTSVKVKIKEKPLKESKKKGAKNGHKI